MKTRLVMSSTPSSKVVTEAVYKDNLPICMQIISQSTNLALSQDDFPVELAELKDSSKGAFSSVCETVAHDAICQDDLLSKIAFSVDGGTPIPLSQQFSFVAGKSFNRYDLNQQLIDKGYAGQTLWDLLNSDEYKAKLSDTAKQMFSLENPLTKSADIPESSFYNAYIPLVITSGAMYPQYDDDGNAYFNPEGNVTVGEFLDSLNSIKVGKSSGIKSKKSLDSISDAEDFYNEGYNSCLSGFSSPFYRLYGRNDLNKPITRLELAYLTVVCWSDFVYRYDTIYSGRYDIGVNVNWETPQKYVGRFKDGRSFRIYKKCFETDYGKMLSININDYMLEGQEMASFKTSMQSGERGIPLPMFMCLFELDALDLFYFENKELAPLKEVSRGELCYFVTKLSKVFNTPFVSNGDTTY